MNHHLQAGLIGTANPLEHDPLRQHLIVEQPARIWRIIVRLEKQRRGRAKAAVGKTLQASNSQPIAAECRALASKVDAALRAHASVDHPHHGRVWAYEVDGYGNALFMDDANVPSLLSLPYLGWCAPSDPTYLRTRSLVLGADNPWFHRGRAAEGIGSPHTTGKRVWR